MVNRGKILLDVALQHIRILTTERSEPVHRLMRSLALSAGIGIEDERPVEERLDHITQGVMHHPITIRGSTDLARFRLVDRELPIFTGAIRLCLQLLLELIQLFFQVEVEAGDVRPKTFATLRLLSRLVEVQIRADFFKESVVRFHDAVDWLRIQPPISLPTSLTS